MSTNTNQFENQELDYDYEVEFSTLKNTLELDLILRTGKIVFIEGNSLALCDKYLTSMHLVDFIFYFIKIENYKRLIDCKNSSNLVEFLLHESYSIRRIAEMKLKELEGEINE